jgi:uncharacterized protein YbjT (DUF2867 family)
VNTCGCGVGRRGYPVPMILVTGSTGRIGLPLVRLLCAAGQPVSVLLRSRDRADRFLGLKVEVRIADLARPRDLSTELIGVERLFLLSPITPDLAERELRLIQAALRASVKHVVKLSALGASPDWMVPAPQWHWEAEQRLQSSGLAWTLLRPTYFMQNLLALVPAVMSGVLPLPLGDARISMIDVRDIAEVAVRALTEGGHEGRVYELTGPTPVGGADVAQTLSDVLAKPVQYIDQPEEQAISAMRRAGLPDWLVDQRTAAFRSYRHAGPEGYAARVSDAVAQVTGMPPRGLASFVRDNRVHFT